MRCPQCGKEFDIREAVMTNADLELNREVVPAFAPHGRLAFEYILLFDVWPFRKRILTVLRFMKELLGYYLRGEFDWKKKTYKISKNGIVEALKVACSRTFEPPLKNHNWLKTVMIGISEKELKSTRDVQDRALRRRETGIRSQRTENGEQTTDDDGCISIGEFARQENVDVANLAANIGRKME